MGTSLAIDTGIRHPQPLYRPSPYDVLLDDLLNVAWMNIAVPDGFGIDHHHRAVLALIQAGRFVGSHPVLQSSLFQGILER